MQPVGARACILYAYYLFLFEESTSLQELAFLKSERRTQGRFEAELFQVARTYGITD